MKKIILIAPIFLLFSCSQEAAIKQKSYFDLAGFIHQKTTQLIHNQPVIKKSVSIDGKQESIETKKIDWKKELELFTQADLNKQAYQLSYEKQETPEILVYTLKKGEDLPVKFLKIAFDSLKKTPKSIEATLQIENYLYKSEKHLAMTLDGEKLKTYEIEGFQELFLGRKKVFKIIGNINP